MPALPNWLKSLLLAPLQPVALLYDRFMANRGHLKALMARPGVARAFRLLVMLTALAWLLVFLFADPRHGERLDQAFREMYAPVERAPAE